jgi:SPP1 family predicted phage head-tail adaptor
MIQDYYTDISVSRVTSTPNAFGGHVDAWSTSSVIQGAINQNSSVEIMLAEQLGVKSTHKLYCDVTCDILPPDRVIDSDGKIYRVVSEPKNTMGINHHYKILLEYLEVDNNG